VLRGLTQRDICTYNYTHIHTQAYILYTQAYNHKSDNDLKTIASTHNGICLYNKQHLPTQPKTSTHALKDIWPHNKRHLPPQRKAFASKIHALEGICPYKQTHTPPQCQDILRGKAPHPAKMPVSGKDTKRHLATLPKASAHALTGISPHNQTHIPSGKSPSSAAKSQKMKARLDPLLSMLLPLETFWYDLSSSAIDVPLMFSRQTCHNRLF